MCGIIARVGPGDATTPLYGGLKNLEYRGYDSVGIALRNGRGIEIRKTAGEVAELGPALRDIGYGNIGIGHTRWATHGPPTDRNAHPHTDSTGKVAAVHNGILTNYEELKHELQGEGFEFVSETDTEVIPHLISKYWEETGEWEEAFLRAVRRLEGTFAVAVIVWDDEVVFGARQGSPLILGVGSGEWYLASDVPAFLEHTDRVVYLEDGDVVTISPDGYGIMDHEGTGVTRPVRTVDWDPEDAMKGEYEHYMLKEIHSQPAAVSRAIEGRVTGNGVVFQELSENLFAEVDHVQFVACGTSYHAGLFGAQVLRQMGIRAESVLASEYDVVSGPVGERSLVVAVSQSGETADTLDAIQEANSRGARTVAVTNVVGSSADREADASVYLRAGPEIGVAATKTYSSQVAVLVLLAQRIAEDIPTASPVSDLPSLLDALTELPGHLEQVLERRDAEVLAEKYLDSDSVFFIGRGLGYSVALEGALKFKEITYKHAEGFPSGELKHGPLALVTDQTPIVAIYPGGPDEKTEINSSEARCRGAPILAVGPDSHPGVGSAVDQLWIPDTHPVWGCLLANVQLQLISYYTAKLLGRSIDKPRNLAKSVTVA